jgi:alpha-aminoadipate carrier protein LysW
MRKSQQRVFPNYLTLEIQGDYNSTFFCELLPECVSEVIVSYCPECEAAIDDTEIDDVGEVLPCPECGVELEVVSVDPVEFDLAPMDEDDDEDDDDEYDFDETDEEEWDEEDSYDDEDEEDKY